MRHIIGLVETVEIAGRKIKARIDTGAARSSIDKTLAQKLKLGPVVKTARVRSAHGQSVRPVVKSDVKIGGRKIHASLSLADRKDMTYCVLIGRNILKKGFMIDTTK